MKTKLELLLAGALMLGAAGFAAAQDITFGGSVKDFIKTAQETQAPPACVEGKPVVLAGAESTPAPVAAAAGLKICILRKVVKSECVYSCSDGKELRQTMNQAGSGTNGTPAVACPQIIVPF